MTSRVSVVLTMAALTVALFPTLTSANLIIEPGFENNNLAPLASIVGPPFVPGLWGYENATNVNAGSLGNTPRTGHWMHEMKPAGGYTQTIQFFAIPAVPTIHASAWFNSDAPAANASIVLSYWANINMWNTSISLDSHSLILDNNLQTWETIDFLSNRPAGATWLGIQVAYLDSSISGVNSVGVDYSGYVDDTLVDVVPEPSSLLALGVGVLPLGSMLLRRRRK